MKSERKSNDEGYLTAERIKFCNSTPLLQSKV